MILKNILAIDGSYFLHRNLKQKNLWEMRNNELERCGGIYGFLNTLQKELRISGGNAYPIVCWDNGQSDRRLAVDDNYKKHREKLEDPERKDIKDMTPDERDEDYVYNYKLQRKKLMEILDSFGIPSLIFTHVEGDDLLYWLSKHSERCKVLTDDSDLLQLLSDTCKVRRPMHDDEYTLTKFLDEREYESINDFVRQKAFCGDASDNIPGACFKVGEKSFKDFYKVYEALKQEDKMDLFKSETELQAYCKEKGFKFKKAYCNFDENRYLRNLELVDLSKIRDSELNDEAIYESIKRVYKNKDVKKTMHLLEKCEIRTINTNVIFENLMMTRYNIKES